MPHCTLSRLAFASLVFWFNPGLGLAAAEAPATPMAMAEHGMVVTAQHLATEVGVDVLKRGGNAVDAAVAVGYTLAVVYPAAGNIGGGGFMTIQLANGKKTFLDFREKAPLAARADMYLDAHGNAIPDSTIIGQLAVAVPGTVSGMEYALKNYGSMPRADLIAPAIRYAEEGFVLDAGDVYTLQAVNDSLAKDPQARHVFTKDGAPFQVGDRLVQAQLATTLKAIREQGTAGFYQGDVARRIAAASKDGHGIITTADLERYKTRELAPVECDYRGFHIVSAPPPSSGGVVVCEILKILEGYPLRQLGFHSTAAMHDEIEAMRHAYADRNAYLGDPDFVTNPIAHLIDPAYATQIRASIDPDHAGLSSQLKPGVALHEGNNTTHYSIVDKNGNAVSVTYTLNDWFGARVMAGDTGILLNNEMDDFTTRPNTANLYGLVQGSANAIAPGKTPLSSMSPTIVSKDGKPVLVVGAPGGSHIITVVTLIISNIIDYGMTLQQAIDAPRFHQQWMPDTTNLDQGAVSDETRRQLESMGYVFARPQPNNQVAAILVGAPAIDAAPIGDNRFYGVVDQHRHSGLALGY
jgi:gamma-glutamyltranspeptidase/glutathione hydrolase